MESLINDIPGMIRARNLQGALGLLLAFLVSVLSENTRLQAEKKRLVCERDELFARQLSGEILEDYDVKMASFDSEIACVVRKLQLHHSEFDFCIQRLKTIFSKCLEDVVKFTAEFAIAVIGMVHRTENLDTVLINEQFLVSYATVRGDGACLFRAFLTALAYRLLGVVLPNDPEGIHEWILRLKFLMCDYIREMARRNPNFERELKSIPENGTVRTLEDYFIKFLEPAYHGTNYDIKILADIFEMPIHVIRQNPTSVETHQSFAPGKRVLHNIEDSDIKILYQPGHFVAIIRCIMWRAR